MSIFGIPDDQQINICFPIPLPHLDLCTNIEDTVFTRPEKVSLRNAFRVLKRRTKQHALQIYLNFYTDNHFILDRYRCGLDKFYLKQLNEHTHWLLGSFMRLVDEGLDNVMHFNIILTDIAIRHKAQRLTENDVTLLAQNIRSYILEVLKKVSSPTLMNAVTKLCQLLVVYHFGEDLNFLKEFNNPEITLTGSIALKQSLYSAFISSRITDRKRQLRESLQSVEISLQSTKVQESSSI